MCHTICVHQHYKVLMKAACSPTTCLREHQVPKLRSLNQFLVPTVGVKSKPRTCGACQQACGSGNPTVMHEFHVTARNGCQDAHGGAGFSWLMVLPLVCQQCALSSGQCWHPPSKKKAGFLQPFCECFL